MYNHPCNARSAMEIMNKQVEKEKQTQTQLNELHKQTSTLTDVKELTRINIECIQNVVNLTSENTEIVKLIAKMTKENQKSSTKQFLASIIVSGVALIIALGSLIVSIFQFYK